MFLRSVNCRGKECAIVTWVQVVQSFFIKLTFTLSPTYNHHDIDLLLRRPYKSHTIIPVDMNKLTLIQRIIIHQHSDTYYMNVVGIKQWKGYFAWRVYWVEDVGDMANLVFLSSYLWNYHNLENTVHSPPVVHSVTIHNMDNSQWTHSRQRLFTSDMSLLPQDLLVNCFVQVVVLKLTIDIILQWRTSSWPSLQQATR